MNRIGVAPGLNHPAFVAGSRVRVDELIAEAAARVFILLFAEATLMPGEQAHYVSCFEDESGFGMELAVHDAASGIAGGTAINASV